MRKTKFSISILVLFIILSLTSCINYEKTDTVKYSKNETPETRYFKEKFDKINISNGIYVIIEHSNESKAIVITSGDFHKQIKTKVENGTLYISNSNNKTTFSVFGYKRTHIMDALTKKVIVKIPIIKRIEANSASKIENKGILRGNSITLRSSSASKINLKLEFEKIDAESDSASKIDLEGMAIDFNANASSASKIDADDLLANNVTAESSSASKISLHPILSLKADANSAGEIKYNTIPKQIEKTINSGGNIIQD